MLSPTGSYTAPHCQLANMGDAGAWHEDAAFWEAFRNVVFPPEKFEAASDEVDDLLSLVDLADDAAVLDVPCGLGRHAVELASRGLDVTAVDATPAYLDEARDHAADDAADPEFVEADMREFQRPGAFDAVVNLYTSFGFFADRADDEATARNFHASLEPGGTLVMQLTGKETLAREYQARTWHDREHGYVLEERTVRDDWSWVENRWVVVEGGDSREFTVSHRLYSAYELQSLLERVGFDEVAAHGDLAGSDYDETADELVVVAEK